MSDSDNLWNDARIEACAGVITAEVGDEAVLLHVESGTYFGLNPVAAEIWRLADQGLTFDQCCRRLAVTFDVTLETAQADGRRFVEEIVRLNLATLKAV